MARSKREGLSFDEILVGIKSLSYSQGMYGRLYAEIIEVKTTNKEAYDDMVMTLENMCFVDFIDFILWYEG